jgi:hypothetical protein
MAPSVIPYPVPLPADDEQADDMDEYQQEGDDGIPEAETQDTHHTVATRTAVREDEYIVFLPLTGSRRHRVRGGRRQERRPESQEWWW